MKQREWLGFSLLGKGIKKLNFNKIPQGILNLIQVVSRPIHATSAILILTTWNTMAQECREKFESGSTAVVAFYHQENNKLYVSHVGDSMRF